MKYICPICGYVYDEEKEGRPFAELPEDWVCPVCTAPKSLFEPAAPAPETPAASAPPAAEPDGGELRRISPGVIAAICSNLARGCEKQYKAPEADLYQELADYFTRLAPPEPEAGLDLLEELLAEDLSAGYPPLRTAAEAEADRGTLRALTWGQKVTTMLLSLVRQYRQRGEAMLENTPIWVCTICGFIYLGEKPPAVCPVCKVPAWKFEEVKGRAAG